MEMDFGKAFKEWQEIAKPPHKMEEQPHEQKQTTEKAVEPFGHSISQSNKVTNSKRVFDVVEQRCFYLIVDTLRNGNRRASVCDNLFDDNLTISMTSEYLAKATDVKKVRRAFESLKKLRDKGIEIETDDGKLLYVGLINWAEYSPRNKQYEIEVSKKIIPYLVEDCDKSKLPKFHIEELDTEEEIDNEWIADSKMETLSYTTRFGNFGFGAMLSCFYVPFTEYNISGERVASNYYTETIAAFNVSYNFLAGYDFKGFASGLTFKTAWRGVPDFADNDTNAIKSFSGLGQSGLAFMLDMGLALQFNFLKYFASRDPNVRVGFAIQNLGVGFTGLGSKSGLRLDDPLPTMLTAGISVKFFPFLTASADIKQPINLFDITNYQIFSFSIGADFAFTDTFSLLAGIEIKGGNPRLSVGGEFEYKQMRVNLNYTLDLTSSLNPVNRISISGRFLLGDRGRAERQKEIDRLYSEGLVYYYSSEWEKAIQTWEKVLEIDKRFDPAILGIESAKAQMSMIEKVRDTMFFEE